MQPPAMTSNYLAYTQVLQQQLRLPPEQWTFKSDPIYQEMLEHVTASQAEVLLQSTERDFPWVNTEAIQNIFAPIAVENDHLGQPRIVDFSWLNMKCSPSNFRYFYNALITLSSIDVFSKKDGNTDMHIIEVGGGYGGLAFYIQRLKHLFQTSITNYTGIDLSEAAQMQTAYTQAVSTPIQGISYFDTEHIRDVLTHSSSPKFFLSAYAFAEFSPDTQQWYMENVIRLCQHGLIVWNFSTYWPHREPNYLFEFTDKPLQIFDESPVVGHSPVKFVIF